MAGRVFLGFMPTRNYIRPNDGQNVWGRFGLRSYSTAKRAEFTAKESFKNMEKNLNLEQFKQTKVKSLEEFKESPIIKGLFGNNEEKISQSYEDYCLCKFNRYRLSEYGGNPGTML